MCPSLSLKNYMCRTIWSYVRNRISNANLCSVHCIWKTCLSSNLFPVSVRRFLPTRGDEVSIHFEVSPPLLDGWLT